MSLLCIINVIFIDMTLNMKIVEESVQVWKFNLLYEILSYVGLFSQFHGLPHFFLIRMLDSHLMHLIR